MGEQSHKREMTDAVRGDFERLRARRERGREPGEPRPAAQDENVLVPPPPDPEPDARAITEPGARRTWRRVLRRRG